MFIKVFVPGKSFHSNVMFVSMMEPAQKHYTLTLVNLQRLARDNVFTNFAIL